MKVDDVTAGARVLISGRRSPAPAISIVTPTYRRNEEGMLSRCLDSASAQTFSNFEHIIIDDGSSDGTEEVVREAALRDDRIVYVRHERNSGLPAVRTNEGILRARGKAIAFLFDDNFYEPDFLTSAWKALNETEADVVCTKVKMIMPGAESLYLGRWPLTLELMRNLNTIPNGGVLVRRSFFDEVGLYDPHILFRRTCDWDLWVRGLALGAKFHYLDVVAATELGVVSPTSIGNTVQADWKFVYGAMQDPKRLRDRTVQLRPDAIGDVDILDPVPILPYVKDESEWGDLVRIFYSPFLERHKIDTFEPALPSNRAADLTPEEGWNAPWALIKPRRRVLLVSNAMTAWAVAWMNALERIPGVIVLNCPEWQVSAFKPPAVDLIVLFDSTMPYVFNEVLEHRSHGTPVMYILGCGGQEAGNESEAADVGANIDLRKVLGEGHYFARPGAGFDMNQAHGARELAGISDLIVGEAAAIDRLQFRGPVLFFPSTDDPDLSCRADTWPQENVVEVGFRLEGDPPPGLEDGFCLPPDKDGRVCNEKARPSWASLGELVEGRPEAIIVAEDAFIEAHSRAARVGLGCVAAHKSTNVVSRSQYRDGSRAEVSQAQRLAKAHAWQGWMANLCRAAELTRIVRRARKRTGRLKVAVCLNSDLVAGSEVYGLMLARNLSRVGFDTEVLIPEVSPYGTDGDSSTMSDWLSRLSLPPPVPSPFSHGYAYLGLSEADQAGVVEALREFLAKRDFDVVITSAFMPVFIALGKTDWLLVQAIFQPSAYDQNDIMLLRGAASGIMSDCDWSLRTTARVAGTVSRVVRSTLPFEQAPVDSKQDRPGPICIAIGGTVQPRKRQKQAILALRTLREQGHDVRLNIYGYELSMLQDYIREIDELTASADLGSVVERHGLVSLEAMAENNDIILTASTDESLPQTLGEMMGRGLVAVAALSGGIDEIVLDGVTGYLTKDLSAAGLASVLERAICDRARWPEIRRAAADLLRQEYCEAVTSAALLDLLVECAMIESGTHGRLAPRRSPK